MKIFISYRRDTTRHEAVGIFEELHNNLKGKNATIFLDQESVPSGSDFENIIRDEISQANIFLVLIGPNWSKSRDPNTGHLRLHDENDYVRLEIRLALQKQAEQNKKLGTLQEELDNFSNKRWQITDPKEAKATDLKIAELRNQRKQLAEDYLLIIPILLGGVEIPKIEDLPDDIKAFVRFHIPNWVSIDKRNYTRHVRELINTFDKLRYDKLHPKHGGQTFIPKRDLSDAPEMIELPAGYFIMGSARDEPGREKDEGPRHEIIIPNPFAIGQFPVTRGQFAVFIRETNHDMRVGARRWFEERNSWDIEQNCSWKNPGFDQEDDHPVVCVSFVDALAYIKWLNSKVNAILYRLPTEAEWEYACRAGKMTSYFFGDHITSKDANFNASDEQGGVYHKRTMPVQHYKPNAWGVYQMHGNIWEYCDDNWDERAYELKTSSMNRIAASYKDEKSSEVVIRGGSWHSYRKSLRSANRSRASRTTRYSDRGFRVVRKLTT